MNFNRRRLLAVTSAAGASVLAPGAQARAIPGQTVWTFDNLQRIGGLPVTIEGAPKVITSPLGNAVEFDGVDDALFIDAHPLAGAVRFTFEAVFRPDGGVFEQRWFHLESGQTPPVASGLGDIRTLFEIRVMDDGWYLDAFTTGTGYRQPLMAPGKLHPIGRWTHVAQTYDGEFYRSFVGGVLQTEARIAYSPQTEGRASVGVRLNRVHYFKGAVREARFTTAALEPDQFSMIRP